MSFTYRPAAREGVALLISIAGASGSGKTMSALRLARGLAGDQPFALLDTESGRAKHYADRFQPWHHGDLEPPFTAERFGEAIKAADQAKYPVVVVDSFSHEYAGEGGVLEQADAELDRMAGDDPKRREAVKMASWIKPKTRHKRLVSQLLQLRCHLIVCLRAEEKIEIVRQNGKTVIRPKESPAGLDGWVPITEKSFPYEMTLSLLLTPDAPGIPKPIKLQEQHRVLLPLDQPLSEEAGQALSHWAAGDAAPAGEFDDRIKELTDELLACADVLGNRIQVTAAVAKNRRANAGDLAKHVVWLDSQLSRMSDAVAAKEQEQIEIPNQEEVPA
jgi:hypothetical protein